MESATKDELIAAIRAECLFGDTIDRIQRNLYYSRCQILIETMQEACNEMDANRQDMHRFDAVKYKRRCSAHRKWERASKALARLQKNEG